MSSHNSEDIRKLFRQSTTDECTGSMSCNLEDNKRIISGHLYLFITSINFCSTPINKSNQENNINHQLVNQSDILYRIPLFQIVRITASNTLFPNSLSIITVYETFFFHGFTDIPSTLAQIHQLMDLFRASSGQSTTTLPQPIQNLASINLNPPIQHEIQEQKINLFDGTKNQIAIIQPPLSQQEKQQSQNIPSSTPNILKNEEAPPTPISQKYKGATLSISDKLKQLFQERSKQIRSKLSQNYSLKIDEKQQNYSQLLQLQQTSAREVFDTFFSNKPFSRSNNLDKKARSFMEYFISEYLNGTSVQVSEISPSPPEIYSNINSSNVDQMSSINENSTRDIRFSHPIPANSPLGKKSITCQMNENIYWCSPTEFILARNIQFTGSKLCNQFEARVLFIVEESNDQTVKLTTTFKVHFKSTFSIGKSAIENAAKAEQAKTWNELRNLIFNVHQERNPSLDQSLELKSEEIKRLNLQIVSQFDVHEEGDDDHNEEYKEGPLNNEYENQQNPQNGDPQNCTIF